ncbi:MULTISPECIES: hypothetical protein [Salimicrobium]|nr:MULTISPECIES: hypothetical protein [Salimicrobium]
MFHKVKRKALKDAGMICDSMGDEETAEESIDWKRNSMQVER